MNGSAGRFGFVLLAWLLLAAGSAAASALIDPFLEAFRVGDVSGSGAGAPRDGWPADLFRPVRLNSVWEAAARRFFAAEQPDHRSLCWTWLVAGRGSEEAALDWFTEHRQRTAALLSGGNGGDVHLVAAKGEAFLVKEFYMMKCLRYYISSHYDSSAVLASRLVAAGDSLRLTAEEVFIWSLRSRRLRELAGLADPGAPEAPWPEMLALGPFDSQSAWAIWAARQRAHGRDLLPAGCGSNELARWLCGLGDAGLTRADLRRAGFSPEAEAAVGAAVLPRSRLDAHFARFSQVPAGYPWQSFWLAGQRRRARDVAAAAESLAALPALRYPERLDLWCRASESRLLRGDWSKGLKDLSRALAQLDPSGEPAVSRQVRDWTVQVMALARARGRQDLFGQVLEMAGGHLAADQRRDLRREAAAYGLLEAGAAAGNDPAEAARAHMRAGRAREIALEAHSDLASCQMRQVERLWEIWLDWGFRLLAAAGADSDAEPRWRDYRNGLEAARRANSPGDRLARVCECTGRLLSSEPEWDQVVAWLLACDLSRAAPSMLSPGPSPMPGLAQRLARSGPRGMLLRHALLAISLASGDACGQLSLASSLPASGLTSAERLLWLYPLPAPGPLLEALQVCDLETALILAAARNESLFDAAARSRAGALGWLQIMPFHYGDEALTASGAPLWSDPVTSLTQGVGLLQESVQRYGGDPYRTLAAYNAGPAAVARWERQLGGGAPRNLFAVWIGYPETKRYVEKVLIDREIYAWILDAGGAP